MQPEHRQISAERQALYYVGMGLIVIGVLLFVSVFFTGPELRPPPRPGDADFWDRAQEQHHEFGRDMKSSMIRALLGMGFMVVGGVLMNIGARGAAGSGVVLNPL